MHFYSLEEIEYLKKISPGRTNKNITELFNKRFNLNLGEKAISAVRKRHGIKTGADGRFEKEHAPWNKGKPKSWKGGEETRFKKGNKPHNWVPVGTERVTKGGYIQVKIQEGKFQHNWKGKHILIWEEHNGPLPKSHAIIFGDGNIRNFDINNLVLVSRRQLLDLNRNNLIQNDAELTKTAVIITDVQRKINERRGKCTKHARTAITAKAQDVAL